MLESKDNPDRKKPSHEPTKAKLGLIVGLLVMPLALVSTLGVICAANDAPESLSELGIPIALLSGIPAALLAVIVIASWRKAK